MIDDSCFAVYPVPFDGHIKALVTLGEDDFYSIYVNCHLSPEAQKKAVDHELRHIMHDDFRNCESIYDVEQNASNVNKTKQSKTNLIKFPKKEK